MRKYFRALLVLAPVLFFGCLGDQVDQPQVVAQLILPPAFVYYKAVTIPTDLEIRWNRSLTDTQGNFKGYFVQLFSSIDTSGNPFYDDKIVAEIDSIHLAKGDTIHTFHNISPLGRYTVRVWGERNNNTDSLVLSDNYAKLAFYFDPYPVTAPKQIYASSAGQTSVNLFWTPSETDRQLGFSGYIIRYIDPSNSAAHVTYLTKLPNDTLHKIWNATVTVPPSPDLSQPIKATTFWIKAIRKDSVESVDSIGITWSGAYQTSLPVIIDTGVFIGSIGPGNIGIATRDVSDPASYFSVHYDGSTVTVAGLHSTTFVDHADIDTAGFADFRFSAPFADNDYAQSSIVLPAAPVSGGAEIYALMPSGRARIFFSAYHDSTAPPRYVLTGNGGVKSVTIQSSFQPKDTKLGFY